MGSIARYQRKWGTTSDGARERALSQKQNGGSEKGTRKKFRGKEGQLGTARFFSSGLGRVNGITYCNSGKQIQN